MKTITIRKIPPDLARELEKEARKEKQSLAKTVISLLLRATGLSPDGRSRVRWDDLDHLAGTWSDREGEEFERVLRDQRRVDNAMWE